LLQTVYDRLPQPLSSLLAKKCSPVAAKSVFKIEPEVMWEGTCFHMFDLLFKLVKLGRANVLHRDVKPDNTFILSPSYSFGTLLAFIQSVLSYFRDT
jgi:hypothetical protein